MVTMDQIAQRAGVSQATVSYVLNQRHRATRISEGTRQRVLSTARELGYRRNALAHAMVTGKNPVIALLAWAPEGEVVARVLGGALDAAEEQQYTIKVLRLHNNQIDYRTIERCIELRIAGALVMFLGHDTLDHLRHELEHYAVPVAIVDSSFPQTGGIRVVSDDLLGCHQAVEHLVRLGHRRIAFLSGRPGSAATTMRELGFRAAMAAFALPIPPGYLVQGWWEPGTIRHVTEHLLKHPDGRPTAIVCASDETAMVVLRTARKQGLRVPHDLSVIGYADLTMAALADPPLTSVAQPFAEMGRAAVHHLLRAASKGDDAAADPAVNQALPTRLIVRESTAPANPYTTPSCR